MTNLIVSSAIFGLGLGGIALMLWPVVGRPTPEILAVAAAGFAATLLLLIAVLKWLPFNFAAFPARPAEQLFYFSISLVPD